MKIKSVNYYYLTEDGHKEERFVTYRFNEDCQVEKVEYDDHSVEYHYLPDGNKYEEITTYDNGDVYKVRYDYDDEGGLIGTVKTDKYGGIVAKSEYDWIKPYRVVKVKNYQFFGDVFELSMETKYYRKDGKVQFCRGLECFTKYEYDNNGHLTQIEDSYCVDVEGEHIWLSEFRIFNENGLLTRYTDETGKTSTLDYDYDEYGNWIRLERRIDNCPVSMVSIREIEYIADRSSYHNRTY